MTNYLLDSNIWIGYFLQDKRISPSLIESESHHTAEIAIAEITDKLLHDAKSESDCAKALQFLRSHTILVQLDHEDYIQAAKIKRAQRINKPKFGLSDAMHLQAAKKKELTLLTLDRDFKDIEGAKVLI